MQTISRILQVVTMVFITVVLISSLQAQPHKKKKNRQLPSPPLDTFKSTATIEQEFVSVEVEPHPIESIQKSVVYPDSAKRYGLEGKVILSALIDTNGKVVKVKIDKSTNPIFDEPAKQAMLKTSFTPAFSNGRPVRLWYTIPIVFKLSK